MATKERLIIESMLMIADKDGNDVPFILNPAQARLDARLTGRDIVPKARQEGVSSYALARGLVKCLGQRNTRAVVISHETEATQRMLNKVHYMIETMRGPKPIIKNSSKNEITFPKTNSMFYIGTAGAKKFGRGDTITFLHCSEVAFWESPKDLLGGLFQAVPKSGEIMIESTGNGMGNYYHRQVMRAAANKSRYRLHFLDWHGFPEYTLDLTPEQEEYLLKNFDSALDEHYLYSEGILTLGQIAWRREKIEELDYDINLFKQEYPMTLDECFQATGRSIFTKVNYEQTDQWKREGPNLYILGGHPKPGCVYALGVDVSGGVGQDNSVIEVICLNTMEQVGEYINDRISPDTFATKVAELGEMFNFAYITPENNNHGIVTISELLKIYPNYLIHVHPLGKNGLQKEVDRLTNYGFRTSVKSKPYAIGVFRKLVATELVIHSPFLKNEMDSFIEKEDGKMEAEEGCHDDTVMAMAVICATLEQPLVSLLPSKTSENYESSDPFSLNSIISEMHSRDGHTLIPSQIATEDGFEDFNSIDGW